MKLSCKNNDDLIKVIEISSALSQKMANMSLVAAVFVVMMHVGPYPYTTKVFWFDWFLAMMKQGFCQAAMPWFWFAAGYFLVNHYGQGGWYWRSLRSRSKSLVVPYLCWGAIYMLCTYGLMRLGLSNYQWPYRSWMHLLSKMYGITYQLPASGIIWFMRDLLLLVLISPGLIYLLRKAPRVVLLLTFLLAWVSPVLCRKLGLPNQFFYSGIPLEGLPYFLAGIYFRFSRVPIMAVHHPCVWLLVAFCMLSVCHLADMQYLRWPGLLASLMGIWGLVPDSRWPRWLTASSFPVYLIHWLLLTFLMGVYKFCGIPAFYDVSALGYLAQVLVAFSVSLLVAASLRIVAGRWSWLLFGGR